MRAWFEHAFSRQAAADDAMGERSVKLHRGRCGAPTRSRPGCFLCKHDVRHVCLGCCTLDQTSSENDATSGRQYPNSPTNVQKLRTLALLSFTSFGKYPGVLTHLQSDPPTMRAVEPTFHATSTRTEDSYAPEDDL